MNKNNIVFNVMSQSVVYVAKYLASLFLVSLICEALAMIFILTTNSGFEKVIVLLLSYTPFQQSFAKGTFSLGIREVVSIFSFWSFVIFVITLIVDKFLHLKLAVNSNLLFLLFSTILHLAALVRQSSIKELLPTIILFYIFSLVAWFFYRLINKLSTS